MDARSAQARNVALLRWHDGLEPRFRIRACRDPWSILVAETMSQQTQMARVDERWEEFVARFPTPDALARSTTAELLRAWAGLGYNRRAVSLRAAAWDIVTLHESAVPGSVEALEALPGIGPYTARAVAARAHGIPVAGLDVNVRRVLERTWGGDRPSEREVQARADALVDRARPGAWNDAVMDLAALVCTRRAPDCEVCPVAVWCRSAGTPGDVADRPARETRIPFAATRRWLRGRLVAELRDHPAGMWLRIEGSRGIHGPAAVQDTLGQLAREGLLEIDPSRGARLR